MSEYRLVGGVLIDAKSVWNVYSCERMCIRGSGSVFVGAVSGTVFELQSFQSVSQSLSQSSGRNYSGPENIFILGHHTCAYVCLYKCLSETSKPFLYDFNL